MYSVSDETRKPIFEGVQGENESREIQFDISSWIEELGEGVCTATAKRPTDTTPYPVTVTRSGNVVTWKPNSTDTAIEGIGAFQLEYSINGSIAKTRIWNTKIAPSLDPAGDPPDPYDNWLAEMRQIAADATQAAQDADASADEAAATIAWFGHALVNTDFERGSYNFNTGTKAGDAKRLRTKNPIRVKEKTIVKVNNLNGLYYAIYVFQDYDSGNDVLSSLLFSSIGSFSGDSNTKWNTNDYMYIPVAGYMVILIANGKNYASSTDIQLSDNNSEWFISNEPIENPISSEIFTTENCTTGVYVKESDGTTGGNSSTGATDYIDLDDYYDVIVLNNPNGQVHQGAFYDENKVFVAGYYRSAAGDFYVTVPRGAKYIRVSYVLSLASSYKIGVVFKEGIATRFYNLKMNCLGDSITYGYIPDSGAQMQNPYPSILKDLLGLAGCRNYGISGSTLAVNSGNYQPMCTRYASMSDDADIVLVFGGTNDYGRAVYTPTLGTINDSVNTTVYGALNILCDGLITKYPKAFIFLCTPLKRADKTGANGGGYTLEDVANAIREVGLKFGIPVLDLDAKGGFYISNSTFRAQYGGNDKLHPNQAFDTDHLAPMIARFIESNM